MDEGGQIDSDTYTEVIVNSIFTLSPAGHNPECFRLFEAVEAGSIPVMVKSDLYITTTDIHPCREALKHWNDAPLLVLDNWDDLFPTMHKLLKYLGKLDSMQRDLQIWYEKYMKQRVRDFEDFMIEQPPLKRNKGKTKNIGSSSHHQECTDPILPETLSSMTPGEVNTLRRTTGLANPVCYTKYLPLFAEYTRKRIEHIKNHLVLHIPKAGGTSLCDLATSLKKDTPTSNNCWERDHFYPLWCCKNFDERPSIHLVENNNSCHAFDQTLPKFTMNENYLDYPLCLNERLYSVILREPISRVKSHFKHLNYIYRDCNRCGRSKTKPSIYQDRLSLGLNSYQTWALAVGSMSGTPDKVRVVPRYELLQVAKDTLFQLDYILDPISQSGVCTNVIVSLMMGEDTGLPHSNDGGRLQGSTKQQHNITEVQYKEMNELDIELHEFAVKLMELDCEFFMGLYSTKAERT